MEALGSVWSESAASAGDSGAVGGAFEDAEEIAPGADGDAILMSHNPRDLVEMSQIVSGPGGQELGQSDYTERGMTAAPGKILGLQIHRAKLAQIRRAQTRKFVQ